MTLIAIWLIVRFWSESYVGLVLRNFETFTFKPKLSLLMKITKIMTRVNSWILTNSSYIWLWKIFTKIAKIIYRLSSYNSINSPQLSLFLLFSIKNDNQGLKMKVSKFLRIHSSHFTRPIRFKSRDFWLVTWYLLQLLLIRD